MMVEENGIVSKLVLDDVDIALEKINTTLPITVSIQRIVASIPCYGMHSSKERDAKARGLIAAVVEGFSETKHHFHGLQKKENDREKSNAGKEEEWKSKIRNHYWSLISPEDFMIHLIWDVKFKDQPSIYDQGDYRVYTYITKFQDEISVESLLIYDPVKRIIKYDFYLMQLLYTSRFARVERFPMNLVKTNEGVNVETGEKKAKGKKKQGVKK